MSAWSATLLIGFTLARGGTALGQNLTARLHGEGAVAVSHVDPTPGPGSLTETRVEQVNVILDAGAFANRVRFRGTLNLEGLTLKNGVLTLGGWGEGFNDRRHPHTYGHELILSVVQPLGKAPTVLEPGARPSLSEVVLSLSVGKGFAPFGSDDPMSRPLLRFPVNHHWGQVLERAVAIGGLRVGPAALEAGLFNGDEPERPGQWPLLRDSTGTWRFGDSWSARLTVWPLAGVEIQSSHASVKSPENRPGAGTTQKKWSGSLRVERRAGPGRFYALGEWARTTEAGGFFRFRSWLFEGSWSMAGQRPYYRFESTDRPEEERTLNPFRSLRPHLENSILGRTRWNIHTLGYSVSVAVTRWAQMEPLAEVAHATVSMLDGLFNPQDLYGRSTFWSVTAGLRLRLPGGEHRMGRYGVLDSRPADHQH